MKYDFTKVLTNFDDSPYLENGKEVTFLTAFKNGILGLKADTGAEKVKHFDLYLKLKTESESDFDPAEVALLDKAIEGLPTLFYGELHYFLAQQ